MSRSFAFGSLLALPLALVTHPGPAAPGAPAQGCADLWDQQPLVVFDVTGYTLGGPLDLSLVVYGSGVAKLSSASAVPGQGKSSLQDVAPQQALAFAQSLFQAGSFQACDQPLVGSDVPLHTLSVFRGGTDAKAHTFSWWFAENEYATFQQLVNDFIGTHFPGF